jgi:hypothetical protein
MNNFDMATVATVAISIMGAMYAFGKQSQQLQQISRDINRIADSFRYLEREFDNRMDILNERVVRIEAKLSQPSQIPTQHHTTIDQMDRYAEDM